MGETEEVKKQEESNPFIKKYLEDNKPMFKEHLEAAHNYYAKRKIKEIVFGDYSARRTKSQ